MFDSPVMVPGTHVYTTRTTEKIDRRYHHRMPILHNWGMEGETQRVCGNLVDVAWDTRFGVFIPEPLFAQLAPVTPVMLTEQRPAQDRVWEMCRRVTEWCYRWAGWNPKRPGTIPPCEGGRVFRIIADEFAQPEYRVADLARDLGYWPWSVMDVVLAADRSGLLLPRTSEDARFG
jgi:hypothetical protein